MMHQLVYHMYIYISLLVKYRTVSLVYMKAWFDMFINFIPNVYSSGELNTMKSCMIRHLPDHML